MLAEACPVCVAVVGKDKRTQTKIQRTEKNSNEGIEITLSEYLQIRGTDQLWSPKTARRIKEDETRNGKPQTRRRYCKEKQVKTIQVKKKKRLDRGRSRVILRGGGSAVLTCASSMCWSGGEANNSRPRPLRGLEPIIMPPHHRVLFPRLGKSARRGFSDGKFWGSC